METSIPRIAAPVLCTQTSFNEYGQKPFASSSIVPSTDVFTRRLSSSSYLPERSASHASSGLYSERKPSLPRLIPRMGTPLPPTHLDAERKVPSPPMLRSMSIPCKSAVSATLRSLQEAFSILSSIETSLALSSRASFLEYNPRIICYWFEFQK